jgi:hypothetical protein
MTDGRPEFPVHRVVIALESICDNVKALEIAAELAARIPAELHGIFMEDVNLLSAARLPFVHQVKLQSGGVHGFEAADVESEFRALAAQARTCLQDLASRLKVPWSFEVHRGDRSSLMSVTRRSDLLVVETASKPFARYMKLPTDWSAISLRSERACLLLSGSRDGRKGTLVVHDGTEDGERAIAAAVALDGAGGPVTIAVPAGSSDADRKLVVAGVEAQLHRIEGFTSSELLGLIRRSKCDLAILPLSLAIKHGPELRELLAAPPCAILLVR